MAVYIRLQREVARAATPIGRAVARLQYRRARKRLEMTEDAYVKVVK